MFDSLLGPRDPHPYPPPQEGAGALMLLTRRNAAGLSYDFSRREGEKEPLGEGGCPLVSGEGRIGSTLTV